MEKNKNIDELIQQLKEFWENFKNVKDTLKKTKEKIEDFIKPFIDKYTKIEFEEYEKISLEDIIDWFKKHLEENPDLGKYALLLGDFKKLNENYSNFVKPKYIDSLKYRYLLIQGFYNEKFNKFEYYRLIATEYLEDEIANLLKEDGIVFFE